MQVTQDEIKNLIASNPVVMYAMSTCPHCIAAKETLDAHHINAHIVYVDKLSSSDKSTVRSSLNALTGKTSVP